MSPLRWLTLVPLLACLGCPNGKYEMPKPKPSVEALLAELEERRDRAQSFMAESVMDYWVGDDKVKGTVWVMGKRGARLRFNALNPDAGTTAVDLACDGTNFEYVDYHNNCQLTGLCNQQAIKQLLGVSLKPDDFLMLALGTTPIIEPDPEGKVSWDAKRGAWVLDLTSSDRRWSQTIILDGRKGHKDVLESTVRDAEGEVEWKLTNKDFVEIEGEDGETFRVPKKTRFQKPKEDADLIVRWEERTLNLELPEEKFQMRDFPAEIPRCGERR